MKSHFLILSLLIVGIVSGCSSSKKSPTPARPAVTSAQPIVVPDSSLTAKVISVNTIGRFVVLYFPDGQLPTLEQTLFIYRSGLKVASVKISGPQQEYNIVADLISGEARVGDNVRDQ